jgi:oligopeptide transport system substrate-binding protein
MFKKLFVILTTSLVFAGCTRGADDNENAIHYALRINLKAIDPAQASEETANEVIPTIFEGLYEYNYLKRPLQLQPLLAEAMPEISKDGLTYKIKIRPGVKFQDNSVFKDGKGREMVASDFIYSWKRIADPRLKGEGWWILDGHVKGLNEWREKLSKNQGKFEDPVEGLTAPDDHTLIIKLPKVYYQLNFVLAMPYTSVVPHEAVEKWGEEFMNHPVGTGPFKFESWTRGNKLVVVRNPTWHGQTYPSEGEAADQERGLLADAGKALPFVDKIYFTEVPEDQPRWLNFRKGSTDWMGIPKDNYAKTMGKDHQLLPDISAQGIKLWRFPWIETIYIGFNMTDPILGKNVELRRALSMSYNEQISAEKFYNNEVLFAQSQLAPELDGYDPNFKNPYKEFNLEKAKEHLKKAGYPDGKGLPPLEYSMTSSTTDRQMAEFLQQQFAQIGVKVNLVSNSWPQFIERLNNRKAQMFGISWLTDYPDQMNMLQTLYSKNASPGSNNANYNSKAYDELFEAAEKLPPGPKRTALIIKMRDQFVQDMPWIPTVSRISDLLYHGWVNNMKRHETLSGSIYKYIRIDTAKKKELKAKL